MNKEEIEIFYPTSQTEWRLWLQNNHNSKQSIWLVYYKKKTGKPTLTWSQAVDEALCFGWIDSVHKKFGDESSIQFFSKRKPKSTWSKINKEKVKVLVEEGKMDSAGLESIQIAKQNGSWSILDEVEELTIPEDFGKALQAKTAALDFFLGLSKSVRKGILQWLVMARRQETRERRIAEIVELAANKQKPKQF